jgi:hypothetical protein
MLQAWALLVLAAIGTPGQVAAPHPRPCCLPAALGHFQQGRARMTLGPLFYPHAPCLTRPPFPLHARRPLRLLVRRCGILALVLPERSASARALAYGCVP